MSDRFINLEIGGAPLVMYGAIATTVAVIAYATVSGGFGESATNAIGMNPVPSSSSVESTAESSPNTAEQTTGGAKKNKKTSSLKKARSHKKSRKTPKKN